jgi:hypothetical protein
VGVGDQLVTIRSRDNDGAHPFELTLWKPDEDPEREWTHVETLSSANYRGEMARVLADLWKEARGEALQINNSIEAALSDLGDDD